MAAERISLRRQEQTVAVNGRQRQVCVGAIQFRVNLVSLEKETMKTALIRSLETRYFWPPTIMRLCVIVDL